MLCEKCKKMVCASRNEALALSAKLGIVGRHALNGDWYPGDNPQVLEDWCKKNCKSAKPTKEKIITPVTVKEKKVSSNKNSLNKNPTSKDKKKD